MRNRLTEVKEGHSFQWRNLLIIESHKVSDCVLFIFVHFFNRLDL